MLGMESEIIQSLVLLYTASTTLIGAGLTGRCDTKSYHCLGEEACDRWLRTLNRE